MNKKTITQIVIAGTVLVCIGVLISNALVVNYSDKFLYSLMTKTDFVEGGQNHPWYIAPMKGYTVILYNGSQYFVNSDYWDSCEHNPDQGHLIGIGYVNKTACDIRCELDKDVLTRNYTATRELILWENATLVRDVLFIADSNDTD